MSDPTNENKNMSRHQFQHGHTLDALELRGGVPVRASRVGVGHTVIGLGHVDLRVGAVDTNTNGDVVLRNGDDTMTLLYHPDEFVYIVR